MNWSVLILVELGNLYDKGVHAFEQFRRSILYPVIARGRHDMNLLSNGAWVDSFVTTNPLDVTLRYTAETHSVTTPQNLGRPGRWTWLSAVQEGRDMSDFFADLRADPSLTAADAVMLYAHQNRWMPSLAAPIHVVDRDGQQSVVHLTCADPYADGTGSLPPLSPREAAADPPVN